MLSRELNEEDETPEKKDIIDERWDSDRDFVAWAKSATNLCALGLGLTYSIDGTP